MIGAIHNLLSLYVNIVNVGYFTKTSNVIHQLAVPELLVITATVVCILFALENQATLHQYSVLTQILIPLFSTSMLAQCKGYDYSTMNFHNAQLLKESILIRSTYAHTMINIAQCPATWGST